jgi:hypothetical protein
MVVTGGLGRCRAHCAQTDDRDHDVCEFHCFIPLLDLFFLIVAKAAPRRNAILGPMFVTSRRILRSNGRAHRRNWQPAKGPKRECIEEFRRIETWSGLNLQRSERPCTQHCAKALFPARKNCDRRSVVGSTTVASM